MTVFCFIVLLFSLTSSTQYVAVASKMDPIDIPNLTFNHSFVTKTDDSPFERVDLPFGFRFYDKIIHHVWITPNGYLSLKPAIPCYGYYASFDCNLETIRYDALIGPYLSDLNPYFGNNATLIKYRIESDRLIVIWDNLLNYHSHFKNSFMVVLQKDSDIIFCYKEFQWPFANSGYSIDGLVGIRPFLEYPHYSTRSQYIRTNNGPWYTYVPATLFFQPRDFIYNYIERFIFMPTEYCVTPSIVTSTDIVNITVHYSWMKMTNVIKCRINRVSFPALVISSSALVCLNINVTELEIQSFYSHQLEVGLILYASASNSWIEVPTLQPTVIQVGSQPVLTCGLMKECDSCGLCLGASEMDYNKDRCIGNDNIVYGQPDNDCIYPQIRDDRNQCCLASQIDCNGVCNGTHVIANLNTIMKVKCCEKNRVDCNGVCDGTAYIDLCGICSEGNTNHIANSDMDCNGVCFGSFSTNCPSILKSNITTIQFKLGLLASQSVQEASIRIENIGKYPSLLYKQLPKQIDSTLAPHFKLDYLLNNTIVTNKQIILYPHNTLIIKTQVNITSSINMMTAGCRKYQPVDLLFTPLTRNTTEGFAISMQFDFDFIDCELITDYNACILLPHCQACVYDLDDSNDAPFFRHTFMSLSMDAPLRSETKVFTCTHGDSISMCSSLIDQVEEANRRRKYNFKAIPWLTPQVYGLSAIILIVLCIVIYDISIICRRKQFLIEMLEED